MPPATTTGAHRVFMAITMATMERERQSQALEATMEAIMEVITVAIMEVIMEV